MMADLTTTYLGLTLRSPLVASASPLNGDLDNLRRLEAAGAGAAVLPSLFEEQIVLERTRMDYYLSRDRSLLPAALRDMPDMKAYNQGLDGYLRHIALAKEAVTMPIIASVNGSAEGGWLEVLPYLVDAGADAVELNVYYLPANPGQSGAAIEARYARLVAAVRQRLTIPIAVKLSPYFSNLTQVAGQLVAAGAGGLVLFNRFYQPDFDIETERVEPSLSLSDSNELRLRLRWVALLAGRVEADLAVTGGVHTPVDALKAIYAGAQVAMTASALFKNGVEHMRVLVEGVGAWLDAHGHADVAAVRGRLSERRGAGSDALTRANYMEVLKQGGEG